MTKKTLQKEWRKIKFEIINKKSKIKTPYSSEVARARELLLFAQIALGKIETSEKVSFYQELYEKIMTEYYQKKF